MQPGQAMQDKLQPGQAMQAEVSRCLEVEATCMSMTSSFSTRQTASNAGNECAVEWIHDVRPSPFMCYANQSTKASPPLTKAITAVLLRMRRPQVMAVARPCEELSGIQPSCDASDNASVHIENVAA